MYTHPIKQGIKPLLFSLLLVLFSTHQPLSAQSSEYGKTLNLGVGLGYYGYVGHSIPVVHANYEFDVAKNFTLAPFITYYSYKRYYRWGNNNTPYRDYYYSQNVIPIGVKGTYYFDKLVGAGTNWDFYIAGSLGLVIRSTRWEDGYYGDRDAYKGASGLYLDLHLGTEYHFNNRVGAFLDLSSGVSTIGLSFHGK